MCYILITRLFKMVLDSFKKGLSKLWRGRSRRDSEESAQGVSSKPLQSEKQSNPMGKSKRNQQGSSSAHSQPPATSSYPYHMRPVHRSQSPGKNAVPHYPQYQNVQTSQHHDNFSTTSGAVCAQGFSSTHSQQPAPSTSPYHRRTGHMSQSPENNAVTHYPQYQKCQTSQHHDNLSTTSGAVCAQVEAKLGEMQDQCTTQNANGGSPMYEDNENNLTLYQEENEIGSYKHTATVYSWSPSNQAQSRGNKSSSPSTPNFSPRNTMEKPPAFNGSKSSGVQQTENTTHSLEPTQVEQTIMDRQAQLFGGLTQRKPATRSHSHSPFSSDGPDQGPVTRSQTKLRHSTPGFIPIKNPFFGSPVMQDSFGNCYYSFVETGFVKTEPNDEFDPKKYIPEGLDVPPLVLKRMTKEKSEVFCQQEIEKLVFNNEQLDKALQLANQSYDMNNVGEMVEQKQKVQEMYEIVHAIPFFECETLKYKIADTECTLRHCLDHLEKHLPPKEEDEEVNLMDMEIEKIEQVLSPNYELPPDLDIPTSMVDRIRKKNDPKYAEQQIIMLKKVNADIDKITELIVETKNFCGSLAELKKLKSRVGEMDVKVDRMSFWNHQPLRKKIDKAKLELQDALHTIGCAEILLQDVKNALLLVDTAIHNKKPKYLNTLQNKMACLEKKLANYLTESTLPVNLKSEVDGTLEMLHARQEQVNAVVAAFETFMEVIRNVDKVEEKVKKLQTVKDVNEVLNQIGELLNFCKEFETLDNTTLSGMKDFTHQRLKNIEEHTSKAKEFLTIREELDTETVAVNDLANQINEFWGTMAELQILKQQIHEKKNALFKFSSVENSQLKSILDQTLKMLSDSKNLLEDRAVLIEGQSCQDGPEEESNLEADKPPDLSKMLSESCSMEDIGKLTFQLLSVHRQLSDKTVSIEQGKWLKKQLVECDSLLEHMKLKSPDERKYQTQALEFCRKLQTQVKEAMKLKQDVPVNVSSIALTALGFYNEIEKGQLNRGRARWLEVQLIDCQTRLDAIDLPEGVAREARRDVLNLCNEALKSLNALAVQHNW